MPAFHTKTIESILDPVAQQVSRLVILHEEAEDGAPMAELSRPVSVVRQAVSNLVIVGKETINGTTDAILRQDVPTALTRVEKSCQFLEEASQMLNTDPYSKAARKRLIEGSGGILQGTSSLLLYMDESEVRRIVEQCQRALDYIAVTEVLDSLEDLIQFLKDLSPTLANVTRVVTSRANELTHRPHADALLQHLEQVKTLAPILICSIKNYIHILQSGDRGLENAIENRNYLASRISDEIHEIIRVLQLTSYDEDESDLDNLTVMKKLLNSMQNKMNSATDWLLNANSLRNGAGEKSLRQILECARKIAGRSLPQDGRRLEKLCGELETLMNALCELRDNGAGTSPQAESVARGMRDKLNGLVDECARAIDNVDKSGLKQIAHTVDGRLEQARKWLTDPSIDDQGLGQRAIALITDEARRVAESLPAPMKNDILQLCDDVDVLSAQLADLCARGMGGSDQAREIARRLSQKLHELKAKTQDGIVNRVVEDFIDIVTPLKKFTEAVLNPNVAEWEENFNDKANALRNMSDRAVRTARMVAAGGSGGHTQLTEKLQNAAMHLDSLTPQLVNAGSIRMTYPDSTASQQNFDNLHKQFAGTIQNVRDLCDEATNTADFIRVSEEKMRKHTHLCEDGIREKKPMKIVDNASSIARLANRVILVSKQEIDNSEDSNFINKLNEAINGLQQGLPTMVQTAKNLALNPENPNAASKWREANKNILNNVGQIRKIIEGESGDNASGGNDRNLAGVGDGLRDLSLNQQNAPPRPPLPSGYGSAHAPQRPPLPQQFETDDENDEIFNKSQSQMNEPIMSAAHGLHRVLRQWSSKDNEMIAAAKKVALLMARLSELVHCGDSKGSKRELIATAKAIADASEDVSRIAKRIAFQCTDKRIRNNLLQVSERIPTIATQLKILSTVKATMLGEQDSEEDREATLMLEGNAQNLMNSVKETVKAAEAASIKIQMDTEGKLKWVRRVPWFQYYWT